MGLLMDMVNLELNRLGYGNICFVLLVFMVFRKRRNYWGIY